LNLDTGYLERLFSPKIELYLEKYSEIIAELRENIIISQKIPCRIHADLREGKWKGVFFKLTLSSSP
jgi:hypothetical protein